MRHKNLSTKLSRTKSHRKATIMNIMRGLFNSERVITTLTKAKVTSKWADKVVTLAKKNNLSAIRQVEAIFQDKTMVSKIFKEIGPKFENRQGGYTRVVKVSRRRGDGSIMAILELTYKEAPEMKAAPAKAEAKVSAPEADKTVAEAEKKAAEISQPEDTVLDESTDEEKE